MFDCLEHASSGAYELMKRKFANVFQTLETNENVKNINREFEACCGEVVVIEFNSLYYDLNLVKQIPIQQLLDKINFVIGKVSKYLFKRTTKSRFLDIPHFLAPNLSYRK